MNEQTNNPGHGDLTHRDPSKIGELDFESLNNVKRQIFRFSVGDWSDDGHGHHEDIYMSSSVPLEELREIYVSTSDKTEKHLDGGNDKGICREHEDEWVTRDDIIALGLNPEQYNLEDDNQKSYNWNSTGFAEL